MFLTLKNGLIKELKSAAISKKGIIMSPKETGEKIKEHEQILIEMRKEISALGYTVSQHQSYFELLQKLSEQQKIEVVKN